MFAIIVISSISLIGSFICSLMEAALYSIPHSRIESLKRDRDPDGIRLSKLREKIDEPIAAILTLNTAVNVMGSAWAGALVAGYYGDIWLGFFSAVFTAGVLFFSEIVPKSLGVTYANGLAPRLSILIQWLVSALWPFVRLSVFITRLWGKDSHLNYPTEEDIISLTHLSHDGGGILPEEAKLIANALRLNEVRVRDIMTPSSVVYSLEDKLTLGEIDIDSDHWHFSRIPVFTGEGKNNIVGVVHRRDVFLDLLKGNKDSTIHSLMNLPDFISEDEFCHELLNRFLVTRRHLFCVRNAGDEFVGVVTLEDVLEYLIGTEIVDEIDIHEDMQALARRVKIRRS
jgi:CBS domain containing-hemolysin-like protein